MMCNEVNNVHILFTNSELYTHDAKAFPHGRFSEK